MRGIKGFLLKRYDDHPNLFLDISTINIHRMYLVCFILGLINIVHIVIFWSDIPSYPNEVVAWYFLIIIIHAIMFVVNGILGLLAYMIEKKSRQTSRFSFFVQYFAILLNLFFGILLCVSDQLVTTNINSLFIACIVVGVIFLVPPLFALFIYIITFVLVYYMVTWTQQTPQLLEHIRINSVTATGVGFGISWILWKNYLLRVQQQELIKEQQRKLEEKNEHLQFLARHDSLTGLFSRSYFIGLVEEEIMNNMKNESEACIILMDIDYFKYINDEFGHPAGDQILKETAKILTSTLKSSDISARLGGEEFIILLPETDLQTGCKVAEELRKRLFDYSFKCDKKIMKITASFGVAQLTDSFHNVYSRVDRALYSAKENGRNCIEIAG